MNNALLLELWCGGSPASNRFEYHFAISTYVAIVLFFEGCDGVVSNPVLFVTSEPSSFWVFCPRCSESMKRSWAGHLVCPSIPQRFGERWILKKCITIIIIMKKITLPWLLVQRTCTKLFVNLKAANDLDFAAGLSRCSFFLSMRSARIALNAASATRRTWRSKVSLGC